MIYVIKQSDYIYITDKKRDLDSDENNDTELILSLDWPNKDIKILEENLRPYQDLLSPSSLRYKNYPDVLSIIESHPQKSPKQHYVYKRDVKEILEELSGYIKYLVDLKILDNINLTITPEEILEKAIYRCDVYNLVSDEIGKDSYDILNNYINLKPEYQQMISNFYKKTSKQDRIFFLRNLVIDDITNIIAFIPKEYITNLKLFGFFISDDYSFDSNPEYKDNERLDNLSKVLNNPEFFIRKEIYNVFSIDEIWKGKDIKETLKKIYSKLGTQKKSRVHDIFKYFNTAITRTGYRLISRKAV